MLDCGANSVTGLVMIVHQGEVLLFEVGFNCLFPPSDNLRAQLRGTCPSWIKAGIRAPKVGIL